MRVITVKQPFAHLVCSGIKDVENRTWKTDLRGRVLIHASKKPEQIKLEIEGQVTVQEIYILSALNFVEENDLFGCIIGSVEIVDCVQNHPSIWAEKDCYNWVLAYPVMFCEPIPNVKGKLGLWDFPDILALPDDEGILTCNCQIGGKGEDRVSSFGGGEYRCVYCGGKWYK